MFDKLLEYIELGELIAIFISVISLMIALYILKKDKAIIHIEKHSAKISDDKKSTIFIFYLDNIGKQPTTIKQIEFYTSSRYMPKNTLFQISKEIEPLLGEDEGIEDTRVEGVKLPFHLMPHSSRMIKAKLDFISEDNLNKEHNEEQIHYWVKIKHTSKKEFNKKC